MRRVVIVGPGGSGKSTLARELSRITGLPAIELDEVFWRDRLVATPRDRWVAIQQELVKEECWILDGDLGPYDVIDVRLGAADTVIFLDFPLVRCAWRAIVRSWERADFWRWLIAYRWKSRPVLAQKIREVAATADVHIFRTPGAVKRFVDGLSFDL